MGVFVFATSYIRFWQGIIDFGLSAGYYFCVIFGIPHNITPTVNEINEVQTPQVTLPNDYDGFKTNTSQYFSLLFSGDNFNGWLAHIAGVMANLAKILIVIIPCIIVAVLVIRFLYRRENNKHGVDTIPLRIFKFFAKITYRPVKRFITEYIAFIRRHGWIWKCWIAFWVFHFNLARRTKVGINDYREYVTERASVDELKLQNSYFINSLYS